MSLPLTTNTSSTTLGFKLQAKTPPSAGKRPSYTSCQSQNGSADEKHHVVDRRNILIGLTGVCGASTTLGNVAVGAPIKPVDLGKCHPAKDESLPAGPGDVQCCPPDFSGMPIKDFKVAKGPQVLRTRAAAHLLTDEYIAKYKAAIAKMKALPDSDPWSFYQQALIHCQYCNGAYDQVGFPNVTLQVHNGWFFAPWHRFYLHFWEKILGKLIGDPTFAVPYWNWDAPKGMFMPDIYKDPSSPLYNKNRNKDHYSAILDFKYARGDPNPPKDDVGTLETLHNTHHAWVGPTEKPYWDMGNFHTAGRDTLFWAHHANVDRMWHLFSGRRSNTPEFKDKDWLDSSFILFSDVQPILFFFSIKH